MLPMRDSSPSRTVSASGESTAGSVRAIWDSSSSWVTSRRRRRTWVGVSRVHQLVHVLVVVCSGHGSSVGRPSGLGQPDPLRFTPAGVHTDAPGWRDLGPVSCPCRARAGAVRSPGDGAGTWPAHLTAPRPPGRARHGPQCGQVAQNPVGPRLQPSRIRLHPSLPEPGISTGANRPPTTGASRRWRPCMRHHGDRSRWGDAAPASVLQRQSPGHAFCAAQAGVGKRGDAVAAVARR
jgi:hypothetical protein